MDINRAKRMGFAVGGDSGCGDNGRPHVCGIKTDPTYVRIVEDLDKVIMCGVSWIKCKINNQDLMLPFTVSRTHDDGQQLVTKKSILGELISFVTEKEPLFDQDGNKVLNQKGKQAWGPKRKDEFPDVYDFMIPPQEGAQKWTPQSIMYLNVIDRMDNWCAQNNHTKILGKSDKAEGIGSKLWESLLSIVAENGDVNKYDLSFKKSGSGRDTSYFVNLVMENNVTRGYVKPTGDITPEEQQYEHYDIELLAKLTPSKIILDRLGDDIKWIDSRLGSNYYNLLLQDSENDNHEQPQQPAKKPVTQQPSRPQTQQAAPTTQTNPVNRFNSLRGNVTGSQAAPATTAAPTLTPKLTPKKPVVDKVPCPGCQEMIPYPSSMCPACGMEFDT